MLDPGQFSPPLDGAGLLHLLYLPLRPDPHVLEQVDQVPQEPQLPLTESTTFDYVKLKYIYKSFLPESERQVFGSQIQSL